MPLTIGFKMLLTSSLYLQLTVALRDVHVEIPSAVRRGEKAILKCFYDLEGDSLYSVKWYKGRREFYSYTPKEEPAMKVFQFAGVKVERSLSNESQLVLESVNAATSGKYSCEVSADAPSFHTLISAGDLEVVVPGKDPVITGIRSRYHVGDIVRGNCTSAHSRPAANMTWTINGYEVNPSYVRQHKPIKDLRDLETVVSSIHFVVIPQHFIRGKIKIRCAAYIHDVYWKSTEKSIEEDRHLIYNNEVNLINTFSPDYFDVDVSDNRDNNVIDRSDTFLTHIKGDMSSLNANGGGSSKMQRNSFNYLWLQLTTFGWLFIQQIGKILLSKLLQQSSSSSSSSHNCGFNGSQRKSQSKNFRNTNGIQNSKRIETNNCRMFHIKILYDIFHLQLAYYILIRVSSMKMLNEGSTMKCKKRTRGDEKEPACRQKTNGHKAVNATAIMPIKYSTVEYSLTRVQQQQSEQQESEKPNHKHSTNDSCSRLLLMIARKLSYSITSLSSSSSTTIIIATATVEFIVAEMSTTRIGRPSRTTGIARVLANRIT